MKRTVLLIMVTVLSCFLLGSASNAIAQDACEGNFDCDGDVDGTDAAVFKEDFGRSAFKNPCPDCTSSLETPAPVPKTGQTTSYATEDDGHLQAGVEWPNPRFIDYGDGTVKDNLTGLIWFKDANCFAFGLRTWDEALSDSNLLQSGLCQLTDGSVPGDWRLPNVKELFSLVDVENYGPALPTGHPFINVQSAGYWTSSTVAINADGAWYVHINQGLVSQQNKVNDFYVWPVRGGQTTVLSDNGESCTVNEDCVSGICECADTFCSITLCSAIRCPCQVNIDGDSSCDGFIFPGIDDFVNTCGSTVCDGEGNCLLLNGESCAENIDCASGFCPAEDGVCCDIACSGTCEACLASKTGNSDGSCSPVIYGTDPDNECGSGGVCGGLGNCLFENGQVCTSDIDCLSGSCSLEDGFCCNTPCDGLCQACSADKTTCPYGTCCSVSSGTDPDDECSGTEVCNGLGACVSP